MDFRRNKPVDSIGASGPIANLGCVELVPRYPSGIQACLRDQDQSNLGIFNTRVVHYDYDFWMVGHMEC